MPRGEKGLECESRVEYTVHFAASFCPAKGFSNIHDIDALDLSSEPIVVTCIDKMQPHATKARTATKPPTTLDKDKPSRYARSDEGRQYT